jgi:hypothetical protein
MFVAETTGSELSTVDSAGIWTAAVAADMLSPSLRWGGFGLSAVSGAPGRIRIGAALNPPLRFWVPVGAASRIRGRPTSFERAKRVET